MLFHFSSVITESLEWAPRLCGTVTSWRVFWFECANVAVWITSVLRGLERKSRFFFFSLGVQWTPSVSMWLPICVVWFIWVVRLIGTCWNRADDHTNQPADGGLTFLGLTSGAADQGVGGGGWWFLGAVQPGSREPFCGSGMWRVCLFLGRSPPPHGPPRAR